LPELNQAVARWFEARRGIKRETVEAFGIYTEKNNIVIPYPEGMTKYRWSSDPDNPFGLEKEGREFSWKDAGGKSGLAGQVPFLPPDFEPRERALIFEGETDTMAAWQALPDSMRDKVSVIGLSGVGSWRKAVTERGKLDELFPELTKRAFVVLDNDDPYTNPGGNKSVENGWQQIREDLGRRARRVRLPQGPADVAEFFMQYDWAAFEVLLKEAAKPRLYYKAIDWSKPVPDTDWLVHEMFEMGSVTVLAGDPGLGKSFLTMALALNVARGDPTFLGQAIRQHGQVVYVDEENNEALVRQRLAALGLQEPDWEMLRYLNFAGVNLWAEPEHLINDAIELEARLVILDSQSAVGRGARENSADDMSQLYHTAFKPLARTSGAAVIVIHHSGQERSGPRGSTAINAAADQVITAVKTESGAWTNNRMNLFPSKPRRDGVTVQAQIVGKIEDGWVRVECPGEPETM
jgi:hypothetical protein